MLNDEKRGQLCRQEQAPPHVGMAFDKRFDDLHDTLLDTVTFVTVYCITKSEKYHP